MRHARYSPTTTFETFAFPQPSDERRERIAQAARELHRLREGWLNPNGASDEELELRTLTNLYNEQPSWLAHVHAQLDAVVVEAYGWPVDTEKDDILAKLMGLNSERPAVT